MLPCIVIVAGTGAAAGFELVRVIAAPPAGAAAVSWTATQVESALNNGLVVRVSETGVGGAELGANVPVVGGAGTAAGVGEGSRRIERAGRGVVGEVRDSTVQACLLSR